LYSYVTAILAKHIFVILIKVFSNWFKNSSASFERSITITQSVSRKLCNPRRILRLYSGATFPLPRFQSPDIDVVCPNCVRYAARSGHLMNGTRSV